MKVKIATSPTQSELEEMDLSSTTRKGAECIIGRSPDSDLVLDSNDVSRYHGKFFYHSGNYYFSDLGSKNGTIINGKLLEQNRSQILKNGDVIRIGDFALMLEEDIAISEQSETVVRIINPSMFSNWQGNQNKEVSPELVNQAEQEEVFENYARQVNTPDEITFAQSDDEGEQKIAAETSQETPDSVDVNLEESDDEGEQEIAAETSQENPDSVDVNLEESDDEDEQEIATEISEQPPESEAESEVMEAKISGNIDDMSDIKEEVGEELISEIASASTSDVAQQSEDIEGESQQEAEDESIIKIAPILEEKRIVLISHESKKNELKELVTEHQEFLSYCQTVTWQTYNNYLYRETGLNVTEDIPPATSGGYQAINSMINSENIIAVIFLRDLIVPQSGQASEEALLRACNIREILLANNLPTAQAVIHYLKIMKDS